MTIIKVQRREEVLGVLLLVLFGFVALSAVGLVVLYNRLVNANHAAAELSDRISVIETQTAELKDTLFTLTSSAELEALAASRGLIKDKNPQYLPVDEAWLFASR